MQFTGTHHVALCTPNYETMRRFYTETLGLKVIGGFPNRNIIFLDAGSTAIELIERNEPLVLARQGWAHYAFGVSDIDAVYADLVAKGVRFRGEPEHFPADRPQSRLAFFYDPDGNEIELFQPLTEGYPQP